jgi:hypothetical protein
MVQLPSDNVQHAGVITYFRWSEPGAMDKCSLMITGGHGPEPFINLG